MALEDTEWDAKKILKLHQLRTIENKTWSEIAEVFNTTKDVVHNRFRRVRWEEFLEDPEKYVDKATCLKRWSDEEMIQLDAYIQAGKSYDFIAEKLSRTITAVERQSQQTDWKAWRSIRFSDSLDNTEEVLDNELKKTKLLEQYVDAILSVCRNDFQRLNNIKEKDFLKRVNLDKANLCVSFKELQQAASARLIELGFGNEESIDLGEGRYIIVGDSHGKHTKKDMFALLRRINSTLKPAKIIHIGHILDDDNDISYDWGSFDNLIILAKIEELKFIQDQRNKFKFSYDIVRESVNITDLIIFNQDLISDYVKTPISCLDAEIFDDKVVVNCHRQEFFTRCTNEGTSYSASPGCLCEQHIVKTIKQMDFEDGHTTKQAFHEGFIKYRKMKHTNRYWDQGILVVEVDKQKNHTIIPCIIHKTSEGYTTSYFDTMISSKRVFKPEKKILVIGDMHCDKHDINILDIQEQICKGYKPDATVNLGDTFNYCSLNHHIMDRGGVIIDYKLLDEAAQTHYILKRVATWAKDSYLIYGNHERFERDFIEKFPQFGKYLDFRFICDLDQMGYKLTELKEVLKIGSAKFVHGEMKMFGQPGSKLEKASRTFGGDVFIGHIHRPAIRFGCYSIGLTGLLDQDYNEPEASNWVHGFGLCNQFKGINWLTTVAIVNNRCVINNKTYKPMNVKSWKMPSYKAKVTYEF